MKYKFSFFLLLLLCPPLYSAARRPVEEKPQTSPADITVPSEETITPPPADEGFNARAVFLIPPRDGNPEKTIDLLKNHPELQITLLFPAHYFDAEPRRSQLSKFLVLHSSKQIEIGLTLDNEPVLPLLGNLKIAGGPAVKWGVDFSWPEDIAAQIARASGKYQKKWGILPSGLIPPYLALSEQVMDTTKKFRLNWVLGKPNDTWGVKFFGGTALLISPKPPVVDETADSKAWAEEMVRWTMEHPFVIVDADNHPDLAADFVYLDLLTKKQAKMEQAPALVTGQIFADRLRHEYSLPDTADPFAYDYTPWVSTSQQKRAWSALSSAREIVDKYQRSGRANLQRLDASIEEMCNAESGEFLMMLGQGAATASFNERNFLATLSNVYRLCETPIPANLNSWFATRTFQKAQTKPAENDRPFFVEGPQSLTWNDPKGDDNGSGKYTYPVGSYPKGLFDLRELTLNWTDSDITISASVVEPFANKPTNIVPLIDVYIDVNRLADAGSTTPLRKRGATVILKDAAWEYALTMSPQIAALYQGVPGGSPRIIQLKNVESRGNTVSASFPRKFLRGDPARWRLSVGLMGTENNRRQEEPTPVGINANAGEKNFGGAVTNRTAPYIDLLDATIDDQVERMTLNESGGPLTLPYVEAQ